MKKMNLFRKLSIAGLLSVSMLAGCGNAHSASDSYYVAPSAANGGEYYAAEEAVADYEYDYGFDSYEMKMDDSAGTNTSAPATVDTSRKLITTSYIDVETKEFDQLYADIENYVNGAGGYLESINTYNGSRYYGEVVERHADLTVRIPADKLDDFIKQIGNAGNITNRSQSVEDITLTYVDLEAHKKTLRDEEARLEEFLRNAETIEDMIYIEDRLADVRYQIESMESQLRTYDNKINYSTVYLNISEVVEYTPVVYEEPTTWQRMKDGFSDQLDNIGRGFRNFAVWFVSHIIYLIFWAIVIFAIVKWIIYLNSDKRAAKKAAKAAAKQKAQYEAYQNTMNNLSGTAPVTGNNVQPQNDKGEASVLSSGVQNSK
ncbi:MAG: DUF4349 domain-containing protein [Lachnospiraceae bacterium]|nr:DUF4349 domain-containing protein [Lachnospiraceae bacterium]